MSKITRVFQKIFGSTAGTDQIGKFGSFAAGTPEYSTDLAQIQSYSNFLEGWYGAVLGNNSPAIQDVNALDYLITKQLAYIFQAGVPEWDASTTYYIGSFVSNGTDAIYISIVDNNTNNALSDTTKWTSMKISASTDNSIARYDGTGALQGSPITVGDTGTMAGSGKTVFANSVAQERTRSVGTSVGLGGVAIAASGAPSGSNGSHVYASATIITSGRPVQLVMQSDSGANASVFYEQASPAGIILYFRRGGTRIAKYQFQVFSGSGAYFYVASNFTHIDNNGAAGTYVYDVEINGLTPAFENSFNLVAYEI